MKKTIFISVVMMLLITSCQKQQPLEVKYYPFCGSWGSPNHSLQIWEDGHCVFQYRTNSGESNSTYKVYFHDNIMTLSPGGHRNYDCTIVEAPHTDSLSGQIKMKLNGRFFRGDEEFFKN
jgi:hypothetical protein